MKIDLLLARLGTAGYSAILTRGATLKQREALALRLSELREQGHSVIADEVYERGEVIGDIRVTHYLSCVACKRKVL